MLDMCSKPIFCSKIALKGKTCSRLLKPPKVAQKLPSRIGIGLGTVASWLVRSTPERAVRVRALAGDIVLCSWARHLTLSSQCLSPPRGINGYQRIAGKSRQNCGGVTFDGLASCQGEVEILPATSCYRNRDKLGQLWARLGCRASLY